jgi:hypothetical protein
MLVVALIILFLFVYFIGGLVVSLLTGWEIGNTIDVIKLIFWPITIFFVK